MTDDPRRWTEVREHFHALLDLESEARASELAELARVDPMLAREVAQLLEHAEGRTEAFEDELLAVPAASLHEALAAHGGAAADGPLPGDARLGPWRLLKPIGAGGMGTVYLAERADGAFEMQVAVKLIRADRGRLAQWLATERQVLARLDHPGISRLLDGGLTEDGRAYLVMEWVPGEDLDAARPAGDACLEGFVQIADAVAHAHQRLVVHGDIKPANIRIMPDGRARLLDFGVARLLTEARSNLEEAPLAMTPAFAAPEQLAGEPATTQTDVWSLGALLGWMLTGELPKRGSAVRSRDLRVAGATELAAIIARAMDEDPARRYDTVAALQEDVQRVLAHEPIRAAPTPVARRASLWMRRNPLAATLGMLVAASVLTGATLLAWQARIVTVERDVARVEANRWEVLRDQLVLLFSEAAVEADDPELSARALLDASAALAEDWLGDDPGGQAQMQAILAGLYFALEDFPSARPLLEAFVADDDGTSPPVLRSQAYVRLAAVVHRAGELDRAIELADQGLAILEPLPGDHRVRLSDANQIRGRILRSLGRWPEAIAALERGVELATDGDQGASRTKAAAESNLAITLARAGEAEAALDWYHRSLETWRALGLEGASDALNVLNNLAGLLHQQGLLGEAEPLYQEAIQLRERHFGDSGALGALHTNYGQLLVHRHRMAEARDHLERSLPLHERFAGATSPDYAMALRALGDLERVAGDVARADAYFAEAESLLAAALGPDHLLAVLPRLQRALLLRHTDPEAAMSATEEAIETLEAVGPPAEVHVAAALCEQAILHLDNAAPELALAPAERCREVRRARLLAGAWQIAEAEAVLAAAQLALGDESAASRLRLRVTELANGYGPDHPRLRWFEGAGPD